MADLHRLLRPKHIAVFGGAWARNVIMQLQKSGFEGDIWPIHPTKQDILGLKAYANVAALPKAPDASFIGVNRTITPHILGELAKAGAGGAVCFASGFAETSADDETVLQAGEESGSALQKQALDKAGDMPFLGPNCYGFVNYLDKVALWPDEHGAIACDRGVGIITQSSNMAISLSMSKRSLPLAMLATVGNQAQIDMCDLASAMLDDPRITAIGLHIEGISDLKKLEALACKSRQKKIPIVALKVGKSEAAQHATMSHTASLAGSDESASALLRRLGIARLASLGGFVESLKLAHYGGVLDDYNIASLSCSGGEASLVADCAASTKLIFPPLSEGQKTQLGQALGPLVHLSNPLDYQTYIWGDHEAMTQTFAAMLEGPQSISCLVLDPPRLDRCDDTAWLPARDCLMAAVKQTGKRAVMISTLPETLTEAFCAPALDDNIAPLMGLEDGLAAIEAMADIGANWQSQPALPLWDHPQMTGKTILLGEDEAKAKLADYGIDVPRSVTVSSGEEAVQRVAEANMRYPLVTKGIGFAHKTESGAVALGITDADMMRQIINDMEAPDGYLVEEMITGTVAELLVGIVCDPAHGPLLTVAEGGIYTELLQDKVTISLPARNEELLAQLQRLRCWPKMTGYRGKPAGDVSGLLDLIQKLSDLYHEAGGRMTEIEMNPVICTPDRAVAADALITQKES
ncbi:MAG: acetate--CoA ligase family protein [Candidatus Puniceispirillaceae bacterium]